MERGKANDLCYRNIAFMANVGHPWGNSLCHWLLYLCNANQQI